MSYTPPALLDPIVLQSGYTPPAVTDPVVLCAGDDPAPDVHIGTLHVTTAPPAMPVGAHLREQPPRTANSLWSKAPLYRPAPPALAAVVRPVLPAQLAAAAPAPIPPATVRIRERAYIATLAVTAGPIITPPACSVAAHLITIARAAAPTAPLITAPALSGALQQQLDLPDAHGPGLHAQHTAALSTTIAMAAPHQAMQPARRPAALPHQHARPTASAARAAHAEAHRTRRRAALPHQHGLRRTAGTRPAHAETLRTRRPATLAHQHGLPIRTGTRAAHAEQLRRRPSLRAPHAQARPTATALAAWHALRGALGITRARIPWQHATRPAPGRWWPLYEPPGLTLVIPCSGPYTPPPLRCPVLLGPDWINQPPCPPEPGHQTIIIPVLEAYHVINQVQLARLTDGAPLRTNTLTASLDAQSWAWGWSATIPAEQLPLVRPNTNGDPVEVLATLNGTSLRLVVESIARDRRFASATLRIGGRGRAAWLADPHSPIQTRYNTQARTAAQLLDDALTLNGTSIGWAVDWRAADWLVPAGAWSHTGTYIDAAKRLAEAAGAYVQAHDTAATLRILPWYPALPWQWSTTPPDIEIPEDVCEVEGIEWLDKPAYNAVYIVGGEAGRSDRIKRAGSAADHYAPTVIDPLATAPEMTRARGGQILADTGRQAHITLRLPVLPETGIIKPGQLVRYQEQGTEHLGLTRAVTLQHDFPHLWQTIKLETHDHPAEPTP